MPNRVQLTNNQRRAIEFIFSAGSRGQSPTLRELCAYMGFKAIGSAQDLVKSLRAKGLLQATPSQLARALIPTDQCKHLLQPESSDWEIPCLGTVPAGIPADASGDQIGTLKVQPISKVKSHLFVYALRAQGLSMRDAGIIDGDWLLIHQQEVADSGDIVIANVGDGFTCKRLRSENGQWFLQPENPSFQMIRDTPFEVVGKVLAVHRYY